MPAQCLDAVCQHSQVDRPLQPTRGSGQQVKVAVMEHPGAADVYRVGVHLQDRPPGEHGRPSIAHAERRA